MKRFCFLIGIFTILTFSVLNAQNSEERIIKNNISKLLSFSKEKSYENAAKLIVYKGEDKERELKASFNANNADELNYVKRICKKMAALLELSSKYEFGKFSTSKENDLPVYNQDVIFISGEEKLTTVFKFIRTEQGYLLLEMN